MAIDPIIKKKADDIRNKVYGKEVRESLASGLEEMSSDVVENESRQSVVESRQDNVESQWQNVVDETTNLDVVSAPEIIAARNGESDLKSRLDKENQSVTAQLAQTTFDYLSLDKNLQGSSNDILQPLTALVDRVKNENKGLYIPNGVFYLSDDFEISGIQNIIIDGTIEVAEGKTLEVTYSSINPVSCNWSFNYIKGKLRLSGMKNTIARITRTSELELYANGAISSKSSIAYNQFHLGLIEKLSIFSEGVSSSGTGGWINENIFIGGRLWELNIGGNYTHNNNIFYKPSLESSEVSIINGSSNQFHDVRFEGSNTIKFGEKSFNNIFRKTWVGIAETVFSDIESLVEVIDLNGVNNVRLDNNTKTKNLVSLNKFNDFTNIGVVDDSINISSFTPFIDTGLIELPEKKFGFIFKSNIESLRPVFRFYNENKEQITGENPGILSSPHIRWNSNNVYTISSNKISDTRALIHTNKAKYMEVIIEYGLSVEVTDFQLNLVAFENTDNQVLEDAFNYYTSN